MQTSTSEPYFLDFADSFSFVENNVLLRLEAFLLQSDIFSVFLFLVFDLHSSLVILSFSRMYGSNRAFFFDFLCN